MALEGRYRLIEPLGEGGMGVVYKAERVGMGRMLAVKFLQQSVVGVRELVKRFEREVAAMSRLSHPNLTSVIDSGVHEGVPWLAMDFQKGRSLGELLDGGALPARRAVGIARQMLSGLMHAHENHVLHRDLKPDNVILLDGVEGDFVKILDFGLAKIAGPDEDSSLVTATGFAMGTPGYMSPEQGRGAKADERSDVYAVGVMLYEMVVGRRPFVGESPLAVLRMHMDDTPAAPRSLAPGPVSLELERVILKSLEKDPKRRWASAAEMAAALDETPEAPEGEPVDRKQLERERSMRVGRERTIGQKAATIVETPKRGRAEPTPSRSAEETREAKPRRKGRSFLGRMAPLLLIVGGVVAWARLFPMQAEGVRRWAEQGVKRAWETKAGEPAGSTKGKLAAKPAPAAPAKPAPIAAPPTKAPPAPIAVPPPMPPAKAPTAPPIAPPPVAPPPVAPPPTFAVPPPVAPPIAAPPPAAPDKIVVAPPIAAPPPTAPPAAPIALNGAKAPDPEEADDEDDDRDEPPPPRDTPGERMEREAAAKPPAPPPPVAAPAARPKPAPVKKAPPAREGARLLMAGKTDQAILALYAARREAPRDPEVPLLLGHAYMRKNWRSDGLREYGLAARLQPKLVKSPLVIRNSLESLDNDRTFPQARVFLRRHLGAAAMPGLKALQKSKNEKVRRRAALVAGDIARGRK
jgi:serine/threonine protein kinase